MLIFKMKCLDFVLKRSHFVLKNGRFLLKMLDYADPGRLDSAPVTILFLSIFDYYFCELQ